MSIQKSSEKYCF